MSHLDDEDIALLALGEQSSASVEEHLAHCPWCRTEIDDYRSVVQIARSGELKEEEYGAVPPPQVWDRIIAEVEPTAVRPLEVPKPRSWHATSSDQDLSVPRHLLTKSADRRSAWKIALSCAAAAVAGVVLTIGIIRPWQNTVPPTVATVQVAEANLAALQPGSSASASVSVERVDGQLVVDVQATGLPLSTGYYEVWLFNPADPVKMQSLGALVDGEPSRFILPKGFDLDTFSSVDISAETFDGDPNHSATSVLRGTLTN